MNSTPHVLLAVATLLAVAATATITQGAHQAVNWGGTYTSSTLTFADHVPANATGSDGYGDPHGPFTIDADGDGADDSIAGRALDLTSSFSPTSGYSGTSDTFYGGGSVTRENSPVVNDGFSELSILNQGPNDSIHYHVDTGGDSHTFHLLLYWDKADFLNGFDTVSNIAFDPAGSFTLSTAQASGHHTDELLRWVVRDGSQFYISEGTEAISNNTNYIRSFSSLLNWALYNPVDPAGAPVASDLESLDFDESGPYNVSSSTFTDLTAFGLYVEHEAATGPIHVHIESFDANVIPEPSRALLAFAGLGAMLVSRRRRPGR